MTARGLSLGLALALRVNRYVLLGGLERLAQARGLPWHRPVHCPLA